MDILDDDMMAQVVACVAHVSPDTLVIMCVSSQAFNHYLTKRLQLDTALISACLVGKVGIGRVLTSLHTLFEQYEAHLPVSKAIQNAMLFEITETDWQYLRTENGINQKAESLTNNSRAINPKFKVEIKQDMPAEEEGNLRQCELYTIATCLSATFSKIRKYYYTKLDDNFGNCRISRNTLACWEQCESRALIYHHFWRTVATTAAKHVFKGEDTAEFQRLRHRSQIHIRSEFVRYVMSKLQCQGRNSEHFSMLYKEFEI